MRIPRIIIAGTHSGCGKTSVAAGILRALLRRGMGVQAYKVGPGFLDPPHLARAAGRPCRNLDGWMLPQPALIEVFARGADGASAAIIEGMMGLYDGASGAGDEGSTAEVARWLGAPIVLVVDVSASARSAAAAALGFTVFDPQLNVAGVIANRAGGPRHVQTLRDALASSGIPLLGALPANPEYAVAERHLDLLPADDAVLDALADAVAEHVDLDAVLRIARTAPPLVVAGSLFPPMPLAASVRIGVARDEAFSFYYQDALDLLEAYGAQLISFSPLHDEDLPVVDGIYLGGGHAELYADGLASNKPMRQAIAAAVRDGLPTSAEGGGLIYLTDHIETADGRAYPMAGAIAGRTRMRERSAALNHVTLEALEDSLLLRTGESVRAHELHDSTVELGVAPAPLVYRSVDGRGIADGLDGVRLPGGVASCARFHLAANPGMAQRFIGACRAFQTGRRT